jgi:hypothetical protein
MQLFSLASVAFLVGVVVTFVSRIVAVFIQGKPGPLSEPRNSIKAKTEVLESKEFLPIRY